MKMMPFLMLVMCFACKKQEPSPEVKESEVQKFVGTWTGTLFYSSSGSCSNPNSPPSGSASVSLIISEINDTSLSVFFGELVTTASVKNNNFILSSKLPKSFVSKDQPNIRLISKSEIDSLNLSDYHIDIENDTVNTIHGFLSIDIPIFVTTTCLVIDEVGPEPFPFHYTDMRYNGRYKGLLYHKY